MLRNKYIYTEAKYIILIIFYLIFIAFGIIINLVPSASIIIGFRFYLKFIPFFIFPIIYPFTEKQIQNQIRMIFLIIFFQVPVAIYQRFIESGDFYSGDGVKGTLGTSSMLSIIMISTISILLSKYLSKKMALYKFLLFSIILFIPTTINETKGTLILLPIALIIPTIMCSAKIIVKIKYIVSMIIFGISLVILYIPIYDYFMIDRFGVSVTEFFKDKRAMKGYLYKEANEEETHKIMRFDSIVIAVKNIKADPITLIFGLGIGNVMDSFITSARGKHTEYLELGAQMLAITNMIWETGILGLLIYFTFLSFIFYDAKLLRKSKNDVMSYLGLGWCAVTIIIFISLFYKNILQFDEINIIFWYFSGIIVANTYQESKNLQ